MKEKSQVEDIDRSIYDFKDDEKDAYRIKAGLTPEIVQKLSKEKHDPAWMELFRLHSLQIYNEMAVPDWGPSIEGLNMDQIVTYVRPNTKMKAKWSDVPKDIKNTLSVWVFLKQRESHWPVSVPSMIPSWFITMFVRKSLHRVLSIPIWRVH